MSFAPPHCSELLRWTVNQNPNRHPLAPGWQFLHEYPGLTNSVGVQAFVQCEERGWIKCLAHGHVGPKGGGPKCKPDVIGLAREHAEECVWNPRHSWDWDVLQNAPIFSITNEGRRAAQLPIVDSSRHEVDCEQVGPRLEGKRLTHYSGNASIFESLQAFNPSPGLAPIAIGVNGWRFSCVGDGKRADTIISPASFIVRSVADSWPVQATNGDEVITLTARLMELGKGWAEIARFKAKHRRSPAFRKLPRVFKSSGGRADTFERCVVEEFCSIALALPTTRTNSSGNKYARQEVEKARHASKKS